MGHIARTVLLPVGAILRQRSLPQAPVQSARFLFLNYEVALGYAVLATATFAALKAVRPDAFIAVAASGTTADLLRASPLLDELIITPHAAFDTIRAIGFFHKHVYPRRQDFDYVATDGGNERPRAALMALLSGVRHRIGITLAPELFHAGLQYDYAIGIIANHMRLLRVRFEIHG